MATNESALKVDWSADGSEPEMAVVDAELESGNAVGGELRTLAQHSSHYLAGMVASMALGFISFPIFTRAFSVAEYGLMDLAQRVLLALTVAGKVGLQNAAVRFFDAREFATDHGAARSYYSTMFFGMTGTSLAIVLVSAIVLAFVPRAYLGAAAEELVVVILGLVILRCLASVLWSFLRVEERTKAFNAVSVGTKAATIFAVIALIPLLGATAKTYLVGTLCVEAVFTGWLVASLVRRNLLSASRFRGSMFKAGLAFGLPLVVYEFAFSILGSSDRFLVRHFLGANALGMYSVAYGLARTANEFLIAPLTLAIVPIYMRIWTSDGAEKTGSFLTKAFDLYCLAAIGMLAAVAACGRSLLVLLASSKYDGADQMVPIILAGLLIYAMHIFVAAGLLVHKRTLPMAGVLAAAAVFNVSVNVVLLPRMGLMGGAITTLLSYLFCILALGRVSRGLLPFNVSWRLIAQYLVAGVLGLLLATRIETPYLALTVVARSSVAIAMYLGTLYFVDKRSSQAVETVMSWCRARLQS